EETTALFRQLRDETRVRAKARDPEPTAGATPRSPAPSPTFRRSLPVPLTRLVGRDEDARDVAVRLPGARLVTLTGTGCVGKTRLALQVAEELEEDYEHGAWFVDLAPLADAHRVPDAVRKALGAAPVEAGQDTIETLQQYLSARRLLLVLDNCEHL